MDIITTVIAVCFAVIVAVIVLQFVFATFYRPYTLIRLEINTRRCASFLWDEAYNMENQDARESLFNLSEIIDSYATVIRENRIALTDLKLCQEKIYSIKSTQKSTKHTFEPIDVYIFGANIFSMIVISSALIARYPLIAWLFWLLTGLVAFFGGMQWKAFKNFFVSLEVGDFILRPVPTNNSIST